MCAIDNVITLLKQKGQSQKNLCDYLGISKNVFTDWKSGRNKSYMKYLPKIADYFGVSVDYLLGENNNPLAKEQDDTVQVHIMDFHDGEPEVITIPREKYEKMQRLLRAYEAEEEREKKHDPGIF